MCGRFVVSYSYQELLDILDQDFEITDFQYDFLPNYNVAPTEKVTTVIYHNHSFKAGPIIFGGKEHHHFVINTRSERILSNQLLEKDAYKKCIIPATGFYEWDETTKDPYYLYLQEPFYFAGLYQKNHQQFFMTIITKDATSDISSIHSRVPVILNAKQAKHYLMQDDFNSILTTSNQIPLKKHKVSKQINYTKNKDESNIKEFKESRLF